MKYPVFLLFVAITLVWSSSLSYASESRVRSLTKNNVSAFIKNTSHITKNGDKMLSHSQISSYLNRHLADYSRFVSTITYTMPEMPSQTASITLGKSDFIEHVSQADQSVEGYENKVEIKEIKLSWGRKQAFVKTENTETGFMSIPTANAQHSGKLVPINGRSSCAQVIDLNEGIIQMASAVCTTEVVFSEE